MSLIPYHQRITLPKDQDLALKPTPDFARPAIPYAAYLPPPLFATGSRGYFWVSLPPPKTPPDQEEAMLQGHYRAGIRLTALHEAYPGHHLQLCRMRGNQSHTLNKIFESTFFVEGWALYCEKLMVEEGFLNDPLEKMAQLKDLLWRACRVVVDVGLHTGTLTPDEAVAYLVKEARLEEPNARAEVLRYTRSPSQPMSYALGRHFFLKARDAFGGPLKSFHDEVMTWGCLPPPVMAHHMGQTRHKSRP